MGYDRFNRPFGHMIYCAQCGLPVREDNAMILRSGDRTHQGQCYWEYIATNEREEQNAKPEFAGFDVERD